MSAEAPVESAETTSQSEVNGKPNESRKERPQKRGGGNTRFEPYSNPSKRYRVFVSNIPFDVKWQSLKDLMKEKVGEVTYVEHLMDAEGKSRVSEVVEFRTEELMKKAVETVHKYNMNGRPLKVREDPDGELARRAAQRAGGGQSGGMGMGPNMTPLTNIPPSLQNNPNIPSEIIHALQAGRLGSTIFVANLDYKVGWKKLKEVFGMAGNVVRADILEDKDGKSRGMGTVTFEQSLEAVQAISMFNGQQLFNRPMHVKMDEKAVVKGDFSSQDRSSLPHGLGGIGMGLGPGGQPIDANQLRSGASSIGNVMGPGSGGIDGMNYGGMGRLGGMDSSFGGVMGGMDRFGPTGMGRMNEMERGLGGGFDQNFSRGDVGMSRGFGDSFDRGIGSSMSMERMGSSMDRMSSGMDRMQGLDRVGMGIDRMDRVADIDRLGSGYDRLSSGMDRMGPGMDRLGSGLDRMSSSMDRLGPVGYDRLGPSGMERMGSGMDYMAPMGMDRMGSGMDRMGASFDRVGGMGMDRYPATGLDHMASVGAGSGFDRSADMDRGGFGAGVAASGAGANPRKGCQIFVRNLPFDFTWKMLKDTFNSCGHVQYADIKMENGKSKGCGVVRFENPETAERACRLMNGTKLSGREIDVRIDRNA
uniref:Heterogeneous nuclear ribonucleoprotein M n=2 Tax=Erpetoichthys calabaricus TaxID=27687 RepID=A0A8C4THH7_ERPCA